MVTEITKGVKVSVETFYQEDYSSAVNNEHMFAYRVTIENNSDRTVKLISRHWDIFDSTGDHREVDGDGVVGKQPVIEPDESYQYISGSNLRSDIGSMKGTYTMRYLDNHAEFKVTIPEFAMIVPAKLN